MSLLITTSAILLSDADSSSFQYTDEAQPWLSKVPPQTDILITHCPPVSFLAPSLMTTPPRQLALTPLRNITVILVSATAISSARYGA